MTKGERTIATDSLLRRAISCSARSAASFDRA
jgi:hypothetical protein